MSITLSLYWTQVSALTSTPISKINWKDSWSTVLTSVVSSSLSLCSENHQEQDAPWVKAHCHRNKDQTLLLQFETKTFLYRTIWKVPKFHHLKTDKHVFLLREGSGDLSVLYSFSPWGKIYSWKVFTFLSSFQGCDEHGSILRLYFMKCHYPSARATNGWLEGKTQFGGN